jgi:hypothetical protein
MQFPKLARQFQAVPRIFQNANFQVITCRIVRAGEIEYPNRTSRFWDGDPKKPNSLRQTRWVPHRARRLLPKPFPPPISYNSD